MANTTVESPRDVVDLLVGQHEQIKALFDETLSTSGGERQEAFVRLRRLLAVHETAEEEIVHPRARQEIAEGADLVVHRLAEEHEAKSVLSQLEDLDVDSEAFTQQLSELRDAVLDHAEHEEKEEFARLREKLTDEESERLTRTVELAESVAPTRPHPGVESRMANVVTGPFVAMVDRARDAILGY